MARFYSNENFPIPAVRALRRLGHDVLTSLEADNANRAVPDDEVLAFATLDGRILLTQNRVHFIRLHAEMSGTHSGICVCTYDPDFERLALQIDLQITREGNVAGKLLRVYRPDR